MKRVFIQLLCLIILPLSLLYAESYTYGGGTDDAEDAFIDANDSDANFGSETSIKVYDNGTAAGRFRSVLWWTGDFTDSLYGRAIDSAKVILHRTQYGADDLMIYIAGLRRTMIEDSVTWNQARDDISWTTSGADDTSNDRYGILDSLYCNDTTVSGEYVFDVTDYIQLCDDTDTANFKGFILMPKEDSDIWSQIYWASAEYTADISFRPKFTAWYNGGGGGDSDPPDIHDLFSALMVRYLDPDSVTLVVGAVDSADYDTTEIRYGTGMPSNPSDGYRIWAGNNLENDTGDYILSVAQPGWIYLKIFSGDEVPNWSSGIGDSIYFPDGGSGSGYTINIMHDRIISIQEAVNR